MFVRIVHRYDCFDAYGGVTQDSDVSHGEVVDFTTDTTKQAAYFTVRMPSDILTVENTAESEIAIISRREARHAGLIHWPWPFERLGRRL